MSKKKEIYVELDVPYTYRVASKEERKKVCNGCGPAGWKYDVVPDTIYGLYIGDCCDIHDWMYNEGVTAYHKFEADKVFKKNVYKKIKAHSFWLRGVRRARFHWYWLGVTKGGDEHYWKGKKRTTY